jgi:hypothetical protein
MLRVYSSIRKSLLAENKTVKYLKYAVGEVLLIMVGIILALQFQTWNEGRELEQQRLELIENLKADFRNNLEVLEQSSLSIRKKYDDLLLFRQAAAGERNDLSVDELKLLAANGFGGGYRFQPALGSYRTALSTGSIGLLKDPILNQLVTTQVLKTADRPDNDESIIVGQTRAVKCLLKSFPRLGAGQIFS